MALGLGCLSFVVFSVHYAIFGLDKRSIYTMLVLIMLLPLSIFTVRAVRRLNILPSQRNIVWIFTLQGLFTAMVISAYVLFVPKFFMTSGASTRRLIILGLHPFLVEFTLSIHRYCCRLYDVPARNFAVFFAALYSWFQLIQRLMLTIVPDLQETLALSLFLSLEETFFRFTMIQRDYLYYRVLSSKHRAEQVLNSHESRRMKADVTNIEMLAEDVAILTAPMTIYLFNLTFTPDSQAASGIDLFLSTLMQFGIEFFTDMAPSLVVNLFNNRALSVFAFEAVLNPVPEDDKPQLNPTCSYIVRPLTRIPHRFARYIVQLKRNVLDVRMLCMCVGVRVWQRFPVLLVYCCAVFFKIVLCNVSL